MDDVLNFILNLVEGKTENIGEMLDTDALNRLDEKLDKVLAKQDQQILCQIKSGFDAIKDALTTDNDKTRLQRLAYAENVLLPNTELTPTLTTGTKSNLYWIALANYGLAFICNLRSDKLIEVRHLLRMFEADPRNSRNEWMPLLYERFFEPQCGQISDWKCQRTAEITRENYEQQIAKKKKIAKACVIASAVVFLGGLGSGSASNFLIAIGIGGIIGGLVLFANATPDYFRQKALKSLIQEFDTKIDAKCCEIARSLL